MRTFLWMDLWKQCFKSETEGIHSEECPVFWLEHSQRMLFWNQYHISGTTGSTQRSDPVHVTTQKPCKKPKLRGFTQRSAPFQSRRSLECVHGAVNTAQHCRDSLRKVLPPSFERKENGHEISKFGVLRIPRTLMIEHRLMSTYDHVWGEVSNQ
jgi:hypothetical protein